MRKKISFFLPLLLAAGLLLAFSRTAAADDDPPGRVARLNYIQGAVSFQPGGENDWVQANPNRPLTTGDNLWADQGSRGELHIGSTVIRLSSQTGISFLNLNDRTVQIQLAQGTINVRLRRLDSGDAFEVDTPNVAFSLLRPGEYRVDVDPNGNSTVITVRSGEGEVTGGGNAYNIAPGQRASFSGTDTLSYDLTEVEPRDAFDDWCQSRDDREERAQSARYVSRGVVGYEDLDDYGDWREDPDYGAVWVPRAVPVGWAPYRFGHWVWIEPWGWTWVEDEPWGFAPFHYGRWAYVGGYWAWVPGPVVVRPVYAPALVAFVGGSGFSLSVSFGRAVAWFPLGPREVYVPAYRCSPRYVQNVNMTNTTVNNTYVTNVYNNYTRNVTVTKVTYVNQNVAGAVTAVPRNTFVNARPVAAAAIKVTPQQLHSAQVLPTAPVVPARKSIVGAGAPAPMAARPPAQAINRKVVAKLTPPLPPVPYERKQPILSAKPGRPPAPPEVDQLRKPQEREQHPSVKFAPPIRANENTYGVRQAEKPERRAAEPAQPVRKAAEPAQEKERGHGEAQDRPRGPEPRHETPGAPRPPR